MQAWVATRAKPMCRHFATPSRYIKTNEYNRIGMTYFLSQGAGIGGTLKNQISEFEVREVNAQGEIAGFSNEPQGMPTQGRLSDVVESAEEVTDLNASEERDLPQFDLQSSRPTPDEAAMKLKSLVGEDEFAKMEQFVSQEPGLHTLRYYHPEDQRRDVKNLINLWKGGSGVFSEGRVGSLYGTDDSDHFEESGSSFLFWDRRFLKSRELLPESVALSLLQLFHAGPHPTKFLRIEPTTDLSPQKICDVINWTYTRIFKPKIFSSPSEHVAVFWRYAISKQNQKKCPPWRFTLKKIGREQSICVGEIESRLKIPPNSVKWAGTKDTHGITYQFCTVRGVTRAQLLDLNGKHEVFGRQAYEIMHVRPAESDLRLGDLSYNQFQIKIRDVSAPEHYASQLLSNIRSNGFINYFGPQRFGVSTGVPSSDIGLAMLQKDFQRAVRLYLTPSPREIGNNSVFARAKEHFLETGDVESCIKIIDDGRPDRLWSREYSMFGTLLNYGLNDMGYRQALMTIPFQKRIFYPGAFESLLWNRAVVKRLKQGHDIKVGDWVISHTDLSKKLRAETGFTSGDRSISEMLELKTFEPGSKEYPDLIRIQSEEQAKEFTLKNLVIPTPGRKCMDVPEFAELYDSLLKEFGLDWTCFDLSELGIVQLGFLRRVVVNPRNLSWKFVNEQNIRKLSLTFQLPRSCYATVLLAEVMDTHQQQNTNRKPQRDKRVSY